MAVVNSAMAFLPKFFVISGVILMISGVAQVFVRPRKPGETAAQKIINGAVLRAFVFVTSGLLGVLIGLGVIPLVRLG
jgi:ABC-type Co2+ transport system permease subunit